jgi:hypothetical protein
MAGASSVAGTGCEQDRDGEPSSKTARRIDPFLRGEWSPNAHARICASHACDRPAPGPAIQRAAHGRNSPSNPFPFAKTSLNSLTGQTRGLSFRIGADERPSDLFAASPGGTCIWRVKGRCAPICRNVREPKCDEFGHDHCPCPGWAGASKASASGRATPTRASKVAPARHRQGALASASKVHITARAGSGMRWQAPGRSCVSREQAPAARARLREQFASKVQARYLKRASKVG